MSPRLKKWLLIGGGILAVVCVLAVFAVTFLRISSSGGSVAMVPPAPSYDMERSALQSQAGYGGNGYAYDEAAPGLVAPVATEAPAAQSGSTTDAAQQAIDRLIIRNGNITVAVDDTLASRKAIEDMVAGMAGEGAFVVSVNESGSGSDTTDPYVDMTIRVPAARFDEVMSMVAGMAAKGTTPTQSESAEDVTNQYVDLGARLETLEAARQRLLEIMKEAQNAEDLLNAEQQLTQREAEIASIKGQMQYLSQSAKLSSISISLQPYILSQPVDNSWRPAETVRRAWEALLSSLRAFGDFAIVFAIAILPWLAAIGLVVFGIVQFVRWRSRKTQSGG